MKYGCMVVQGMGIKMSQYLCTNICLSLRLTHNNKSSVSRKVFLSVSERINGIFSFFECQADRRGASSIGIHVPQLRSFETRQMSVFLHLRVVETAWKRWWNLKESKNETPVQRALQSRRHSQFVFSGILNSTDTRTMRCGIPFDMTSNRNN